jgi:hypothetical protein
MLGQGEGDTFLQLELQEEDSDDDFQINENAASISQPPLLFVIFFILIYYIQHCFICRPSDSTVPTDAGIEPRTVATGALTVRHSNH